MALSARTNPNLRTSETKSTIRRRFNGNPLTRPSLLTNPRSLNSIPTPANHSADFVKEGMVYSRGSLHLQRGTKSIIPVGVLLFLCWRAIDTLGMGSDMENEIDGLQRCMQSV